VIILENNMTIGPKFRTIRKAESWESALQEIEKFGICGLKFLTTGLDPLSHEIRIITIAIPNNSVYIADCQERNILSDLAGLLEDRRIKKVLYDAYARPGFRQSLTESKAECLQFIRSSACLSNLLVRILLSDPLQFPQESLEPDLPMI
jgi:hypothetical protein